MRRVARVDENQKTIVEGLRAVGASVQTLHQVGKGVPDLLVGWRGENYLLEIKNPRRPKSKRKLNDEQVEWISSWNGQWARVETIHEALAAIGAVR